MADEECVIDDEEFQRIAKALVDPRRREILEMIARAGEMTCGEIVDRLPLTQATVSHHLKELVDADLLSKREERQYSHYSPHPNTVAAWSEELRRRLGCPHAKRALETEPGDSDPPK